jgi:hypothetical protein
VLMLSWQHGCCCHMVQGLCSAGRLALLWLLLLIVLLLLLLLPLLRMLQLLFRGGCLLLRVQSRVLAARR